MRVTEELVRCKTHGEMLKIIEPEGMAFLRAWMVKENARMAEEDWLSSVVN